MKNKIDCLQEIQEEFLGIEDLLQEKDRQIGEISERLDIYKKCVYMLTNDVKELNKDRQSVLKFVKTYGLSLEFFPDYQNDKALVIEAVKSFGSALKFASKNLKDDKDVLMEAVRKNGGSLYYASARLKDDIEIVQEAMKDDPSYLIYASSRLKKELS